MKHRVVINTNTQAFEFVGTLTEIEPDHLILQAAHGPIFIERKHLVFIQTLEDEKPQPKQPEKPKVDSVAKFIHQQLKKDPVAEKLDKLIPPSQLPDMNELYADLQKVNNADEIDEDMEVIKNIYGAYDPNNPITKAANLKQAVQAAMNNEDNEFSMGAVTHKDPLQTILGLSRNAERKKTRDS